MSYRYRLTRKWLFGSGNVLWVMLNPSTADETSDDPTIRRITKFSKAWGYSELTVVNLYPFRATDPKDCKKWSNYLENGPDWYARDAMENNRYHHVEKCAESADLIVAAWGRAWDDDWAEYIIETLQSSGKPIFCLDVTKDGYPKHPLARGAHRVPDCATPYIYRPGIEEATA